MCNLIVFINLSFTASMTEISSVPTLPIKTNCFFCRTVMPRGATPTFMVLTFFNELRFITDTVLSPWLVIYALDIFSLLKLSK